MFNDNADELRAFSHAYGLQLHARAACLPISTYPDTWIDYGTWQRTMTFMPTIKGYGETIDHHHRALFDAPLGHQGNENLIELGIVGFLLMPEAMKLYEMAYYAPGDVLEIGTHKGLSTSILASALDARGGGQRLDTIEIDGSFVAAAQEALRTRPGFDRITFNVAPANDHLDVLVADGRTFGFAFVDHWHGYEATADAIARIKRLLVPGGFILFHDYTDISNFAPDHVYGVYQAVLNHICTDAGYIFCGNFGSSGLFQKLDDIGASSGAAR